MRRERTISIRCFFRIRRRRRGNLSVSIWLYSRLQQRAVIIIADRKRCNFGPSVFARRAKYSSSPRRTNTINRRSVRARARARRQASNLLYGTCCGDSFALFSPSFSRHRCPIRDSFADNADNDNCDRLELGRSRIARQSPAIKVHQELRAIKAPATPEVTRDYIIVYHYTVVENWWERERERERGRERKNFELR